MIAHEVSAVSGRRTSAAVRTDPILMARDVTSLAARADASGITLTWLLPISAGNVVVEREVDPQAGLSLPLRRARAEGQSWRDASPTAGVEFSYHVYAEYRDADGVLVRTPGATVRAKVAPRPRPVSELWASTSAGRTTIGWIRPPSGEVRIYAADAADPPLAAPDTEADLAELARRGRYVGAGQRRVVDENARGMTTYTSVTVDGGQAVAGPSVVHLPVAAPGNAAVTDTGSELVLTFTLPPGVTEAVVAGRRDAPPSGPHDPAAADLEHDQHEAGDRPRPARARTAGRARLVLQHPLGPARRVGEARRADRRAAEGQGRDPRHGQLHRPALRRAQEEHRHRGHRHRPAARAGGRGEARRRPGERSDGAEVGRMPGGSQTARIEFAAGTLLASAACGSSRPPGCQGASSLIADPPDGTLLISG